MLIAEATAALSTSMLGTVVLSLGVLVSLGVGIIGLLSLRREHEAFKDDTNRRFKSLEEFTQEVSTNLSDELSAVRREIHDAELRISASGEHRSETLHIRFNDVMAGLFKVQGRLDAMKE